MNNRKYILLTIDVEDWFMVENLKPWIPFSSWSSYDLRVERNTHRLLDLFDSIELKSPRIKKNGKYRFRQSARLRIDQNLKSKCDSYTEKHYKPISKRQQASGNELTNKVRATFFVLGWIAERLPNLVKEISARGHEVASHGYDHRLSNQLAPDALESELISSKKSLEDIIGAHVYGFRAPSFSINEKTLIDIRDSGYLYDSSYNSFSIHKRYGQVNFEQSNRRGIGFKLSNNFYELPISNLKIVNGIIPLGGGAYFRLIPTFLFKKGIKTILKNEDAYLFYIHPWEIDAEQPRLAQIPLLNKFRHYFNLEKTCSKLIDFIDSFSYCRFIPCSHYLKIVENIVPKSDPN
jgi:polysaccharide deacetylase family protein (PEP-CTERM system associated)